jgi:hypothetical protein
LPAGLPAVDGYVARPEGSEIGSIVYLRPEGQAEWERFLVVDCGGRNDRRASDGLSGYEWMIRHGILVEVGFPTAVRWNTVGRLIRVEMKRMSESAGQQYGAQ